MLISSGNWQYSFAEIYSPCKNLQNLVNKNRKLQSGSIIAKLRLDK